MMRNKGRPISQFDVSPFNKQAYNPSVRVASATNGFNATGLWPLDDSKLDEELFAIAGNQDEGDIAVVVAADVHATPIVANQNEDDIQPAPTVVVAADMHATPIVANQNEDDIQPAPTVVVAADVHIDAHIVPVDACQDEDDIRPPPAVVSDAHDYSVAVNQDYIRRLIKACSLTSLASTSSKTRRRTNIKKASVHCLDTCKSWLDWNPSLHFG